MLTILTIPKPFQGTIGLIQRNAILSWTRLEPSCEVILLGDEEGVREFAGEYDLRHLPAIENNEFGTPLLSSAFELGQAAATFETLAYVNADIILMSDFAEAVSRVDLPNQLLVGRRWDAVIDEAIDFRPPRLGIGPSPGGGVAGEFGFTMGHRLLRVSAERLAHDPAVRDWALRLGQLDHRQCAGKRHAGC